MKISTLILSFCGFCVLYICNADWIDELIEDYLGNDYDEIAPFVSSVTAGTEEFDQIVEELSQSKRKWWPPPVFLFTAFCCLSLSVFIPSQVLFPTKGRQVLKLAFQFISSFKKAAADKEEIRSIVSEFLERKLKQFCGMKQPDDVPVKLLWKGGSLVDSSIHCNIKDESKLQHVQRHLQHSKVLFDPSNRKVERIGLAPSSSETSTAKKIAERRKMLESEQELKRMVDGGGAGAAINDSASRGQKSPRWFSTSNEFEKSPRRDVSGEVEANKGMTGERLRKLHEESLGKKAEEGRKEGQGNGGNQECDAPDPKLMNRIRLLESRLRLEELKNKNWISRMSRAEGILQQLNKQVERIEESQPVGTLTETLKITSTTNWAPTLQPRRNMRFTLVNQYPLFCMQTPYASLSELIKREVGLPSSSEYNKRLLQLPPPASALPSPAAVPQSSSILSKFLYR